MCGQSSGLLGRNLFLYFCYVDVVLCNAFPLLYYAWGADHCMLWSALLWYAMLCLGIDPMLCYAMRPFNAELFDATLC